jgi:hypothetical protein
LARYTITVSAEQPGEPTARILVDVVNGGYRVAEWTVLVAPNGYASVPAIVPQILAAFGHGGALEAPTATADLGLTSPTYAVLWRAGIKRVPELTALTGNQLQHIKGANRALVKEIASALQTFDLTLATDQGVEETTGPYLLPSPVPRQRQGRARQRAKSSGGAAQARVYRHRPADFIDQFTRLKTPSAAAAHYDVPVHTINAWRRALRRLEPAGGVDSDVG